MAEESEDDKIEELTARRLKAKEYRQVLRSQDMTIAAVTVTVIAAMIG